MIAAAAATAHRDRETDAKHRQHPYACDPSVAPFAPAAGQEPRKGRQPKRRCSHDSAGKPA